MVDDTDYYCTSIYNLYNYSCIHVKIFVLQRKLALNQHQMPSEQQVRDASKTTRAAAVIPVRLLN